MYTQRQRRIRFFRDHAGYSIPPGRMKCAADLADAEKRGGDCGWTATWLPDNDCETEGFVDWPEKEQKQFESEEHTFEGCVLRDEQGRLLASLWGICDADDDCRRVVEAELALEAAGAVDESRLEYEMAR